MDNYLYNGVELPELPVYDPSNPLKDGYTEECPYAVIYKTSEGAYGCALFSYPLYAYCNLGAPWLSTTEIAQSHRYTYTDGEWVYSASGLVAHSVSGLSGDHIWANHDIYYGEDDDWDADLVGSVYLAASDPVPVTVLTARDLYRKINGKPTKLTLYKKLGGKLVALDEHTKEVKT